MKTTHVFDKNLAAVVSGAHIICNKGGTRSSKTYSILQLLYTIAKKSTKSLVITIVSESLPHLKLGAMRDFDSILESMNEKVELNKTTNTYKIGNSIIEFFGADAPGKVTGPARDILYVNECNNVRYDVFTHLDVRTRKLIFLDCNPRNKFWMDRQVLTRDDAVLINSTYKDNNHLTAEQVASIESRMNDIEWWNVYGLGLTGGTEGLVYPKYEVVDTMPTVGNNRGYGMDFGFSNDPTACVECLVSDGWLYIDEVIYTTGLLSEGIVSRMAGRSKLRIAADSASPSTIAEIRSRGLDCVGVSKTSIIEGIDLVKSFRGIRVTKRSINVIDELDNYSWKRTRDGDYINEPKGGEDHAMDAMRYYVTYFYSKKNKTHGGKSRAC